MPADNPVLLVLAPNEHMPGSYEVAREHGFDPLGADTVEVADVDTGAFDELVQALDEDALDWVVFTSAQAVESAGRLAQQRGQWLTALVHDVRVGAAGSAAHAALMARNISSLAPKEHTEAGMVRYLTSGGRDAADRVALVRELDASNTIPDALAERGIDTLDVPVFELRLPDDRTDIELAIEHLADGRVAALATVAGVLVRNLLKAADQEGRGDEVRAALDAARVGALDAATAEAIQDLGLEVDVVPDDGRFESLVGALARRI